MKERSRDLASNKKGPAEEGEGEFHLTGAVLEKIITPSYLEFISGAAGFNFAVIDEPPPGLPDYVMGFTNPTTKVIYIVRKNVEGIIKHLSKQEGGMDKGLQILKGLLVHEGGHHAPEVKALENKLKSIIGEEKEGGLVPSEFTSYFSDPKDGKDIKKLYWQAFWFDVCNGGLDVWLEAFQSRGRLSGSFGNDLLALNQDSITGREGLTSLPPHHQLTQWFVGEEVYFKGRAKSTVPHRRARELDEVAVKNLSPEVFKAVQKLRHDGVFSEMTNTGAFESWTAMPADEDRAIARKFQAMADHYVKAWMKLLVNYFLEKKKEFAEQAKRENLHEEQKFEGEKRILRKVLDETQQMGQAAYASSTPSPEEAEQIKKIFDQIAAGPLPGESTKPAEASKPSALDQHLAEIDRRMNELESKRISELADRFKVSPEAVSKVERIENTYASAIEQLATDIAESFISQRRIKTEHQVSEGEEMFGMQDILYEERKAGIEESRLFQRNYQASEFLSTEVEHLIDTSGSMQSGRRLEYAQTVAIVITRAFERVKAILEGENLLRPEGEEPLRTGFVLFTGHPERIKKLDELNIPQTLAQMVEQTGKHSGGTDDAAAIAALESEFKIRQDNVLKFMIIYSDAEGNAPAVQNMMNMLEQDQGIIVIVVAMGAHPQNVANTYGSAARAKGATNIFIIQGDDVNANLPLLSNYLKTKVKEAAERLS